jgi:hypothetical protein
MVDRQHDDAESEKQNVHEEYTDERPPIEDETGELREIKENNGFVTRVLEYILEKLNDFTDCFGCTES